ncbi:Y-family DNA polymerase [Mycoplasma amphoriforme]|uniref:DNA polymerase IV n=1 Tax=Mycoplasma amphoriforme A39 TaxID=572419 RepID=A0A292II67_9MOLU|nr:unnamed protein product [Mycoplasma amphoriforme A39]
MKEQKIIFHLDLDAFFATVEECLNPKLRNVPLIVAGKSRRTVVASANYAARKFKIKAGEPVFLAIKKCPNVNIIYPHFNEYLKYSEMFMDLLIKEFSPIIEIGSIDECYLDVTHIVKKFDNAYFFAKKIQQKVLEKLHLNVSIGISENKFLAKMATDLNKPMGITKMLLKDIPDMLWKLPIYSMHGIGKNSVSYLEGIGIKTIGDLARYDRPEILQNFFKNTYSIIMSHANGQGSNFVNPYMNDPKTIGLSKTLISDCLDFNELQEILTELCIEVFERSTRAKMAFMSISVSLKNNRFIVASKNRKFPNYIQTKGELINKSLILLDQLWTGDPVRLIGVSLGNLKSFKDIKTVLPLFENNIFDKNKNAIKKDEVLYKIASEINYELGKRILNLGSDLKSKE